MFSRLLLKYFFKKDNDLCILLGTIMQKGSPVASVSTDEVWKKETFKKKVESIFTATWQPSESLLKSISKEIFLRDLFGYQSDYNEELFKINYWHNSIEWDLSNLTEADIKKANSLDALYVLLNTKHRKLTSKYLHLNLFNEVANICSLLHPMVKKIPVISIQYAIIIHHSYAFNKIRTSKISNEDDLISYIYELQFIQYKTALSLHELLYLIDYNEKNKGEALLIQAELSAISEAETIISNLKATIEKVIVIIGLIYDLKNLETKKEHKKKLEALFKTIPQEVQQLYYFKFIAEHIKSESIEELNNYRTGLLHKKGISSLQPHSFVGRDAADVPLMRMFLFLIEQHRKNSAVIIATYALLTDKLVELKQSDIDTGSLPKKE